MKKVKGAICSNCNGILQNNIQPFDVWFHVYGDASKICKIVGGKPSDITDIEIDPENGITVEGFFIGTNKNKSVKTT